MNIVNGKAVLPIHVIQHEDGGFDEITLTGLDGLADDADEITVDASGFSDNLSNSDTDVQTALATVNGLTLGTDGLTFVNRGIASAWDFAVGTLTNDGTWNNMDLSGICPADAVAVNIHLRMTNNEIGYSFYFRAIGNTNGYNIHQGTILVADRGAQFDFMVPLDSNRHIEYKGDNTTFTLVDILVQGWWI